MPETKDTLTRSSTLQASLIFLIRNQDGPNPQYSEVQTMTYVVADGKSNWLEGVILVCE